MKLFIQYLSITCLAFSSSAQETAIVAVGAELTLVADGFEFTEGPAVDQNGDVYFTDQPNDRIVKWSAANNSVSDWMHPSGRSNGLYFDHNGNLISCADEKNELWQIDAQKNVTVLLDNFKGQKLGGPNDVWVHQNGSMYFTDPFYKRPWWDYDKPEIEERRVYYRSPEGEVSIADTAFVRPNGIIGSADGSTLYVADIGDEKTYRYKILADGTLINRELFCRMGSDGMTLDNQGNVYLTGNGVTVFNVYGKQIYHIEVPEKWTANVTFGGPEQDILFITAMDAIYTLKMAVHGIR